MGSMLEKITLYDILGYLLPGCLLETIVCLEWILRCGRAVSPVWREPPVRTNGATSVCLLSYFAIAGSSPYTSLIERSLAGSTLSISIL